jgi:D-xylono/L-arabinono-1,4-lactonase
MTAERAPTLEPELVADTTCGLGEGPLWHPGEGRLYWTDITAGRLYRYSPVTGQHEACYSGAQVGGFTVQADGSLLLFMERGAIKRWDPRDSSLTILHEELSEVRESRFNDVSADPAGRVFCGTMGMPKRDGRLYRLDTDGTLHVAVEGVGISNGIGFSPDHTRMYYTDTDLNRIDVFDYDVDTGALTSRRVFAEVPKHDGLPDGLTVDSEGCVWGARWDGSVLVRYTPDGREQTRVAFPARKVSSAAFGGPDSRDLYVTTAGGNDRANEGSGAGALFRLRPPVPGLPDFVSKVRL